MCWWLVGGAVGSGVRGWWRGRRGMQACMPGRAGAGRGCWWLLGRHAGGMQQQTGLGMRAVQREFHWVLSTFNRAASQTQGLRGDPVTLNRSPRRPKPVWVANLGWAGLGWALGWAGLGWAGLGWAGLAGLGQAGAGPGLGWAGLGWAGLGWAGLGWAGLGRAGLD